MDFKFDCLLLLIVASVALSSTCPLAYAIGYKRGEKHGVIRTMLDVESGKPPMYTLVRQPNGEMRYERTNMDIKQTNK